MSAERAERTERTDLSLRADLSLVVTRMSGPVRFLQYADTISNPSHWPWSDSEEGNVA